MRCGVVLGSSMVSEGAQKMKGQADSAAELQAKCVIIWEDTNDNINDTKVLCGSCKHA